MRIPKSPRNRHEDCKIFERSHEKIVEVAMRAAFVVQLRRAGEGPAGQMEGWVEEVDTGQKRQFRCEKEVLEFLRKRFAETGHDLPPKKGIK